MTTIDQTSPPPTPSALVQSVIPVPRDDSIRQRTAEAASSSRTAIIIIIAACGGLCFGYQTAVMSGLLGTPYFVQLYTKVDYDYSMRRPVDLETTEFGLPATTKALMTATLAAGVMIGALLSGELADRRGRKDPIMWGCLLLCIGNVMQMCAEHKEWLFIFGRFVSGLGIGAISAVIVIYISEVSPREWRGLSVAGYQLCISVGICLANAIVTKTETINDKGAYQIPIGVIFVFAGFLGVGTYFLPESPRWLIKQGFRNNAIDALTKIRGQEPDSARIVCEINDMQRMWEAERAFGSPVNICTAWKACFSGPLCRRESNLRRTILGMGIQMMQQLTGINFIFYFGTTFFQQIGNVPLPFQMSLIVGCVNIAATMLSFFTVSSCGRRQLLLWGAGGMFVTQLNLGILGTSADGDHTRVQIILMILLINLTTFIFGLTWGPTAWIVVGECFPLELRARGVGLSAATNWLFNFGVSMATPHLVGKGPKTANLGLEVFFLLSLFCGFGGAFSFFLVPEMYDLSLEEIPKMMEEVSPRNSAGWKDMRVTRSRSPIRGEGDGGGDGDQDQGVELKEIQPSRRASYIDFAEPSDMTTVAGHVAR